MKRLIIDCDPGIDDALAILYALRSPELHVEAITVGCGNVGLDRAARNALDLIELSGCRYAVPVYLGADCALDGTGAKPIPRIHGENGIGAEIARSDQQVERYPAWSAIIDRVNASPGEITLVMLGRMTNAARALEEDPAFGRKLHGAVAMGGCFGVRGNITAYAEANLYGDVRAAAICLAQLPKLTLVGLNVTTRTLFTQAQLERLPGGKTPAERTRLNYIRSALGFYFEHYARAFGYRGACAVHDPLTVLIAEDMSLGRYRRLPLSVEIEGERRGELRLSGVSNAKDTGSGVYWTMSVESDRAVERFWSVIGRSDER